MDYINTKKDIAWGDYYFLNHVAPSDFDYKAHKKELSPFWESLGFRVSMMFSDFYSKFNGIESDKYIPMDLYYFFVLPCLNRFDFRMAYTDKCMYTTIFSGLHQPETVVKCMNGNFYIGDNKSATRDEATRFLSSISFDCIIKPSVDSCNGVGIAKIKSFKVDDLSGLFDTYGRNFIVQKQVKQHSVMASLNSSSLNTLRVFTYRSLDGVVHYLNGKTFGRFGGEGAVMDNGSAGGGLIQVNDDGTVEDKVVYFKSMEVKKLADKGIKSLVIPKFEEIKTLVEKQHERLPYFDLIGWDIAIDENCEPTFIEFNIEPSVEGPQMVSGVFFGEFFDEVINRMKTVKKQKSNCYRNIFANGFEYQQIVNK